MNSYVKKWTERAAATRHKLQRKEAVAYDAVGTDQSPDPIHEGDRVEVKACKHWIQNGDDYGTRGRWNINRKSHERLNETGGWYCLIKYRQVGDSLLIEEIEIVDPEMVPLPSTGDIVKVPHNAVFGGTLA